MVVPFLIIYIFNWTIFFIIIVSLLHKSCKSDVKKKQENISFIRQQLVIVTTLSIVFGLGWGIGLFATQDIHNNKIVRDVLAALFVIVTAFHGFFIFVMQCFRSKDVRTVWKQWFYRATGKDFSEFASSTYGRFRVYKPNISHVLSPTFSDTTVDDSKNKDNLKYSIDKSTFPLTSHGETLTTKTVKKEMSQEGEVKIMESSFDETIVILDEDKQKMTKEEIEMMESSFIPTLECVADEGKKESSYPVDDPETV